MTTLEVILIILLVIETIVLAVTVIAFFQLRRLLNSATNDALSSLARMIKQTGDFTVPFKDQKEN